MHHLKTVAITLAFLGMAKAASNAALVIGGFGATTYTQVVTENGVCRGSEASPVIPASPDGRIGWTAQYVDGQVIVCGGAKVDFYKSCYSLEIGQSWKEDSDMNYARRYPESVAFNGKMVVLGGYNQNQGWLNSVEIREAGGWKEVPEWTMPRKIFDLCAVQMDDTRIAVLGGNLIGEFDSDDMDILDTTTGTWSKGPSMGKRRATHDCIVTEYNGEKGVMVTGGCSENCRFHLKDTDFFSFGSQTWTSLPPLNVGRMGHKMTLINGKPVVIGGFDTSELASVEIFDGTQWNLLGDRLPYATFVYGSPDEIPDSITCQ